MLSQVLADTHGVSGIGLAMTIAMVILAAILVVYASDLGHLRANDSIFIFADGIIFAAMFERLNYHMFVAMIILVVIYILLSVGNWRTSIADWSAREAPDWVEEKAGAIP